MLAAVVLTGVAIVAATAARTILVPPRARDEDTEVLSVDESAGTITLGRSPDAVVDGRYSFWFSGSRGHARLGAIVSETSDSVTRELLSVTSGDLGRARRGRLNGWFLLTPNDLDVDFDTVDIETELGPAPAWLIPVAGTESGSSQHSGPWAIHVHGRAVVKAETLRAVPVFRDAGYTSLVVSYRNDTEAPSSPDGRYALGDAEWHDVDAALAFALEHGATSIVLMGWSMGGAIALQVATRSLSASAISGMVLDSPVIDWVTALDFQARSKRIIRPVRALVYFLIGTRWGKPVTGQFEPIDLPRLDFVRRATELRVPILILHSDDDDYVPSTASRSLAKARPDIITLVSFHQARHTKLWNFDPARWNSSIADWLAALGGETVKG